MSVIDNELESNSQKIAEETAKAGKKLFAFVLHEQAELVQGTINFATFIPKNIIKGVAGRICDKQHRGKQSLKKLVVNGTTLENIPLDKDSVKLWGSVARKYKIDYSLKKAVLPQPDGTKKVQYIVFYKAKDVDTLTAAFQEYSAKHIKNEAKRSINEQIREDRERQKSMKQQSRQQQRQRKREKKKGREEIEF